MIHRYKIIDHDSPRPHAERILFCDGSGGDLHRPETDLDLSHWRPNRTPPEYRAGTSTEICFRFLDDPRPGDWTAAVNNHVDVDGILSVYALVHSEHALAHRRMLIEAAEMGDFWGWGETPAQRVFQGVTQLMDRGGDPTTIYDEAFRRIPGLISGDDPEIPQIDDSLAPLHAGVELIREGRIARREMDARLTHYVIPLTVAGEDDARASHVPEFNEAISPKALLWPQARARWDAERVCLVSIERPDGWFHDLWLPGYLWADTEGKWQVPGLEFHEWLSDYTIHNDQLIAAFERLQHNEKSPGHWALGGADLPFGESLKERFPLVGRFVDEAGAVHASTQPPDAIAKIFEGVFSE